MKKRIPIRTYSSIKRELPKRQPHAKRLPVKPKPAPTKPNPFKSLIYKAGDVFRKQNAKRAELEKKVKEHKEQGTRLVHKPPTFPEILNGNFVGKLEKIPSVNGNNVPKSQSRNDLLLGLGGAILGGLAGTITDGFSGGIQGAKIGGEFGYSLGQTI